MDVRTGFPPVRQIFITEFINEMICWTYCSNPSLWLLNFYTVKPVLNSPSNIDNTKNLMTKGILMKVESIAECSFCNTFDMH